MKLVYLKNRKCTGCFVAAEDVEETCRSKQERCSVDRGRHECYLAATLKTVRDKDGNLYRIQLLPDLTGCRECCFLSCGKEDTDA